MYEAVAYQMLVLVSSGWDDGQAIEDESGLYIPLVAWVHALIDLVDHTERGAGQTLQCHEVEDC